MCDNTAPYTAQEVHLVTTEFKIVDKYTVEYITVLAEAHSSLKPRKIIKKKHKNTGSRIKENRFGTHMEKYIEIRQENNVSKEN